MIILIRHAQSEGNKNRDIHQTVPDHRVKLTPDGWTQAEEAGRKLRSLLRPEDTLHFFTSPYRRTRETTEGILNTLTSTKPTQSPFPRNTIKVYEEPRLREQDFGNFQPDSTEMSRMWQERADYGHFFYRIPNGESAADAYDRVSGFNESLWRSFGEEDFASVSVLVTHGLMTRVFLMKWYHFSVEYFEDLRNVNHCEFVVMRLNPDTGKYVLQNQLRTWSELKRERERESNSRLNSVEPASPIPMRKKWGGCHEWSAEDREGEEKWRARQKRQNTADLFMDEQFGERVNEAMRNKSQGTGRRNSDKDVARGRKKSIAAEGSKDPEQTDAANVSSSNSTFKKRNGPDKRLYILNGGRDFGGSRSGAASPSPSGHFDGRDEGARAHMNLLPVRGSMSLALKGDVNGNGGDRARADALGDQSDAEEEEEAVDAIEKMHLAEKSVDGSVR